MNACIYVETSVISYLANRPSRDGLVAARQALTHDWWVTVNRENTWVSNLVIAEISKGDPAAASRRLQFVAGLPIFQEHPMAAELAMRLMQANIVPASEPEDAMHIALATLHECRYLVT